MLKAHKLLLLASLFIAASEVHAKKLLFSDTFETDTSAAWRVFNVSDNGTPDYTAQFNFLYTTNRFPFGGTTTNLIPLAPNSATGAGRGVKLTVNKDDVADRSAVNIYLKDMVFTDNFSLQFDMWIGYNGPAFGGTGSTEFAMFGINHLGTEVNWEPQTAAPASPSLPASDGIFFAVSGEGGAAGDYRSYEGDPAGNPLKLPGDLGGFIDRNGDGATETEVVTGTPALYPLDLMFPAPQFETRGAPGKRWVQVEIRQKDGLVTWLMNGYVIAEKQNLTQWGSGTIMLGTMDTFASIANPKADNFVIFDNVRVSSLEPIDEVNRIVVNVPDPDAAEPNNPALFTFNRTGSSAAPLTISFRQLGSATSGVDYGPRTNSVTIPAGSDFISFEISPIDDSRGEPAESITLVLDPGTGYEVFNSLLATATLTSEDLTQLSATIAALPDQYAYAGLAEPISGQVTISREGDLTIDLPVTLSVTGTATSRDFQPIGTTVIIPAGATSVTVPVEPIMNTTASGDRTVTITIVPSSNYTIASANSATVTIRNATLLFSDNFETDNSADYTTRFGANNNVVDYSATFGYDYSVDGTAPSPHAANGTTKGVKLTVNKNDAVAAIAGVNIYPKGKSFATNFALKFDMFLNANINAAGSTEHASFGINHSGNITNRHDTLGSDGVWFAVEGDASSSGGLSFSIYTTTNRNNRPAIASLPATRFATAFPSPPAFRAGTPNGQWSDVLVRQDNNVITWTINGILINRFTNSTPSTSGNVMLGYLDEFASIGSTQNYVIFDNVRVYDLGFTPVVIPTVTIAKTVKVAANGQVTIAFSAPGGQASQFRLESAAAITGPFAADTSATIREVTPGQFEFTAASSGRVRFYRIRF